MNFSEKIDFILKHNKHGINTVFGMEKYLNLSKGSIYKVYSGRSNSVMPGGKVTRAIRSGLSINDHWWDTGKGEPFQRTAPDFTMIRDALDVVLEQQRAQNKLIEQVVRENDKLWRLVKNLHKSK